MSQQLILTLVHHTRKDWTQAFRVLLRESGCRIRNLRGNSSRRQRNQDEMEYIKNADKQGMMSSSKKSGNAETKGKSVRQLPSKDQEGVKKSHRMNQRSQDHEKKLTVPAKCLIRKHSVESKRCLEVCGVGLVLSN